MSSHRCRKKNLPARIRDMPSSNDSNISVVLYFSFYISVISDIGANKAEIMEQTKLATK